MNVILESIPTEHLRAEVQRREFTEKAHSDVRVAERAYGADVPARNMAAGAGSQLRVWTDEEIRKATFAPGVRDGLETQQFELITRQTEILSELIQKYCPPGPDRAQALQQIRTTHWFAERSLTHEGVPFLK